MANDYFTLEQACSYLGKSYALGRWLYADDPDHPGVLYPKGTLFLISSIFYDGKGYLVTMMESAIGDNDCWYGPIGYKQLLRAIRSVPFHESSIPAQPPDGLETWFIPHEVWEPDFDGWLACEKHMRLVSDAELLKLPETRGDYLPSMKVS